MESPCTVKTVSGPMSISVVCVRAKYFAQAVATSVERFPAAARLASAPVAVAKADGSCEMAIRSNVVGEMGSRASAGSVYQVARRVQV